MIETELSNSIQYLLIALQVFAVVLFVYLAWPYLRKEKWREKFIENKTARSILIVFVLIFIFLYGIGALFNTLFPIETLS